jgi:Protein of unknown function (DUF1194)
MHRAARWKLRVVAGAAALLALLLPNHQTYAEGDQVDLALVLAVDCSFSVDAKEFTLQMQGLGEAFKLSGIQAAIRHGNLQRIAVSVVQWSDASSQTVVLPWTIIASAEDAEQLGNTLSNTTRNLAEGGTSISSALLYSAALLSTAPKATRRVIDISSDGRNNSGIPVAGVRERLVADGITINALTILNEWPTLNIYFQNQVAGGEGYFVIPADDYAAYAEAIYRKLLKEITGPGVS